MRARVLMMLGLRRHFAASTFPLWDKQRQARPGLSNFVSIIAKHRKKTPSRNCHIASTTFDSSISHRISSNGRRRRTEAWTVSRSLPAHPVKAPQLTTSSTGTWAGGETWVCSFQYLSTPLDLYEGSVSRCSMIRSTSMRKGGHILTQTKQALHRRRVLSHTLCPTTVKSLLLVQDTQPSLTLPEERGGRSSTGRSHYLLATSSCRGQLRGTAIFPPSC